MISNQDILHLPREAESIPGDWLWSRLDDVSEVIDCPHSTPKISDHGPLMARSQDVRGGVFRIEDAARVSEETYIERIKRAEPQYGDILYSREGTYFGIAAEVPPNTRVCLGQRMVQLRPFKEHLHFKFLRYWLNSGIMTRYIHGFRDGSVAERLNMSTIRALPVVLPPIQEQKAIAAALSAFDDKIELNRQMNATLEEMARALFKSWFMDFDPVRRNQAGGPSQPYDYLFPDEMVVDEGRGREIPASWRISTIGDEIESVGGATPSTKNPRYWDQGTINFTTPKDLSGLTTPVLLETERCITEDGLRQISSGLLPIGTVLMSSRAPVGYLAINEIPVAINQGFIAMRCNKSISNFYMLWWAKENMHLVEQRASGTTFQEISKANFRPIEIIVPSEKVITEFNALVRPLYQKIVSNVRESRTMAQLRDTLLPRLMSGQLRMPLGEKDS